MRYKNIAKKILPPFIYDWMVAKFSRSHIWEGNFKNWDEAKQKSTGYEDPIVLEKILQATLTARNSVNTTEQDGQVVPRLPSSHVAFGLIKAAFWDRKLSVLAIGGSLGTSFYCYQKLISRTSLKSFAWNVIEQRSLVEYGRQNIEDGYIRFFHTIKESLAFNQPNCILFSNSLQYLDDPEGTLREINELNASIIILDKVAITATSEARICIQKTKKSIYCASYPMHIFALDVILNYLDNWVSIQQIDDTLSPKFTKEGFKIKYVSILLERRS